MKNLLCPISYTRRHMKKMISIWFNNCSLNELIKLQLNSIKQHWSMINLWRRPRNANNLVSNHILNQISWLRSQIKLKIDLRRIPKNCAYYYWAKGYYNLLLLDKKYLLPEIGTKALYEQIKWIRSLKVSSKNDEWNKSWESFLSY